MNYSRVQISVYHPHDSGGYTLNALGLNSGYMVSAPQRDNQSSCNYNSRQVC